MPGVFTVFNIGTGHTRAEPNNTMARLFGEVPPGEAFINDGPGTGGNILSNLVGNVQGRSMDPRCRAAVDAILRARPHTVNLTGHSRGAVMCHMIANDLNASSDTAARGVQKINMIVLDPVNMSVHTQRGGQLRTGLKQGWYISVVMENVTKMIFPSMTVDPMDDQFRTTTWLHMPGTHGSGTQPLTSAIGLSCFLMIKRCLGAWGTRFTKSVPTAKELCEAFARIHLESPVKYDKRGLVKARSVSDDPKGMSISADQVSSSWQKVGRVKAIAANYERMAKAGLQADNLRDSPYFFNTFHLACFKVAFPSIFARFNGTYDNQAAVDVEIRDIEMTCPSVARSLGNLGMI